MMMMMRRVSYTVPAVVLVKALVVVVVPETFSESYAFRYFCCVKIFGVPGNLNS